MKRVIAAMAVLAASLGAASADTIIMKDGTKIEWRSIIDDGETYTVETESGAKVTVKKEDIDKVVPSVKRHSPLTGATYTPLPGKKKTMNLLAAIDPRRDLFGPPTAEAKCVSRALVCDFRSDTPVRLQAPVAVPEQYDLAMTVERKSGVGDFFIGLVAGGRQFLVVLDSEVCTKSGVSLMDGKHVPSNVPVAGAALQKQKPAEILCAVRRETLVVTVDKKEIISLKPEWTKFSLPETHAVKDGKAFVFIGSQKVVGTPENTFNVTKMALTFSD